MSLKALHKACDRLPAVWTHHDQWAVTNGFTCDLTGKVSKSVALEHTSGLNRLLRRSPYHDNWKNRRIGRLLDHWAPRQPIMVAPSQHLLQSIQACPRYAGSTALHLRNGVSLLAEPASHISQDQARQQWKIPPNRRVVLMLAAHLHDTHKGIRLGLEAIRQQPSGARPLLLLLGKNTDALSEQLNGLEVITGYAADQATLASAYRAADVTMIPSFADNFPFTALESLACQRPIVGFGMEGPGEIIGHNQRGLAAQPYEVDDLAKQLQTLLHDTALCEQLGRAGYQWVTSHCAMDHYLDQLEDIYRVAVQKFQNR